MFRNVLVPVDGTPFAENAIPWALAAVGRGTVHLVHVHVPPPPLLVEGVVVSDPNLDQTVRETEADYLAGLAARVGAAAPDVTVVTRAVESDEGLADALRSAVADAAADLVAMTTHGRSPFARFWVGSVSDEFLRRSPVPVLMARGPEQGPGDLAAARLTSLVVPLDGSDLAEKILDPAIRLTKTCGGELTLVLVLDRIEDGDAASRTKQADLPDSVNPTTPAERAGLYLDRVARRVGEQHVAARTKLVREGAPAAVVLELAKNNPTVGIALATHGRSGLTRLLRGSVADEVIRGAAGPVLVFHPPG